MKTRICLLLVIVSVQFSNGQASQGAAKTGAVKFNGIYECKEWKFIDDKIDNPEPAYYRFYPDGVLLFCSFQNPKDKDSVAMSPEEIYSSVLSEAILAKIQENMEDDPARVYKSFKKFKVTAYKYQKITGGLCFDILSEKPNCLGKPNMKMVSSTIIKTDNGNPADDRYFKFVPVY